MENQPHDEFDENRPEDEPIIEPAGPVGVYPIPDPGLGEQAGLEEQAGREEPAWQEGPVPIEEEWTLEETTESPEAVHSAPEPGTGEIPPPASQEYQTGGPYGGAQPTQAPYSQALYGQVQKKDKSLTIILEILPAFFGIMGIGWLYGGNTNAGLAWLIGFLIWNGIALFLDFITFGIFLCVHIPVNLGLIALSTILLNNYTKQHPEVFN